MAAGLLFFLATMNPGRGDAELLTGADIRRYRKSIGLTQLDFAKRMEVSQSALSLLESGRIAVSDDHVERLQERFRGRNVERAFTEYLSALEADRAASGAALTASTGRHLTLTVWRWEDGYDLGQAPSPEQVADLVTIRATSNATIAFQMPQESGHWARDEILVFEECRSADVMDEDVCLLQLKPARTRTPRTVLAVARRSSARRSPAQLTPIRSKGPTFAADNESVQVLMRVSFRGRNL